jgi:hypothetical protein
VLAASIWLPIPADKKPAATSTAAS